MQSRSNQRYYAANGDADGLCALQQLRLVEDDAGLIVTGVKRDVQLLRRVVASPGDVVTALDISLDRNRHDVLRLLELGARVRYFDHHFPGAIPHHPNFEPHVDQASDVCTSILVDRYLSGRHRAWAIVGAFGDGLMDVGLRMARQAGFGDVESATLRELGTLLNYNAYGNDLSDVNFDPAFVAAQMLPFEDPRSFVATAELFDRLRAAFERDMQAARTVTPIHDGEHATLLVMPDERWARRAIGTLANELRSSANAKAIATLVPNGRGGYTVSVRVPESCETTAEAFCRRFETGGGRRHAAGINHLPASDLTRFRTLFLAQFETCSIGSPRAERG